MAVCVVQAWHSDRASQVDNLRPQCLGARLQLYQCSNGFHSSVTRKQGLYTALCVIPEQDAATMQEQTATGRSRMCGLSGEQRKSEG